MSQTTTSEDASNSIADAWIVSISAEDRASQTNYLIQHLNDSDMFKDMYTLLPSHRLEFEINLNTVFTQGIKSHMQRIGNENVQMQSALAQLHKRILSHPEMAKKNITKMPYPK